MMWVYQKTEESVWTVGFFRPDSVWVTESDHTTPESAAAHVHFLNGGSGIKAECINKVIGQ